MNKELEALEKLEECANGMKDLPKSNWIDLAENEAELDLKIMYWVETIKFELFKSKQALIKAQELETMADEYDLKPYELREALLVFGMMKGAGYKVSDIEKAQEQEKVLEIIKEKCLTNCNLALVKDNVLYENYCNEFKYFLNKYNESPNGFEITKEDLLTEEEFELLKRLVR